MSIKIAPSILSADFANLQRDIERIATADYVHVDVMDGLFVPNISIGIPVVKSIRPVTEPASGRAPDDRPARAVCGAVLRRRRRYRHRPCGGGHAARTSEAAIRRDPRQGQARRRGAQAQDTSAEAVLPFMEQVEMILVMTVEPGFGGQKFMADQMHKVAAIRGLDRPAEPRTASWRWTAAWTRIPATACHRSRRQRAGGRQRRLRSRRYRRAHRSAARCLNKGKWPKERRHPMEYFPAPLENLVEQFAKLPGIGGKTRPAPGLLCAGPEPERKPRPSPRPSWTPSRTSPAAPSVRT